MWQYIALCALLAAPPPEELTGEYKPPKGYDPIKALTSSDPILADYAHGDLAERRSRAIAGLVKIVADESLDRTRNGPVVRAIGLLGYYRAREAVEPLAKLLTLRPVDPPPEILEPPITIEYFPAAFALAEIGRPADRKMYRIIIHPKSTPLERKLAVLVLVYMEVFSADDIPFQIGKDEVVSKLRSHLTEGDPQQYREDRRRWQEAIDFIKPYEDVDLELPPEKVPGLLDDAPSTKKQEKPK